MVGVLGTGGYQVLRNAHVELELDWNFGAKPALVQKFDWRCPRLSLTKSYGNAVDLVCSANGGFMSTSPSVIRVLTVDDHALLREGIAALVNAEPDMELVAEASDGEEAIKQFRRHHPDVTLMDLQMPSSN